MNESGVMMDADDSVRHAPLVIVNVWPHGYETCGLGDSDWPLDGFGALPGGPATPAVVADDVAQTALGETRLIAHTRTAKRMLALMSAEETMYVDPVAPAMSVFGVQFEADVHFFH